MRLCKFVYIGAALCWCSTRGCSHCCSPPLSGVGVLVLSASESARPRYAANLSMSLSAVPMRISSASLTSWQPAAARHVSWHCAPPRRSCPRSGSALGASFISQCGAAYRGIDERGSRVFGRLLEYGAVARYGRDGEWQRRRALAREAESRPPNHPLGC